MDKTSVLLVLLFFIDLQDFLVIISMMEVIYLDLKDAYEKYTQSQDKFLSAYIDNLLVTAKNNVQLSTNSIDKETLLEHFDLEKGVNKSFLDNHSSLNAARVRYQKAEIAIEEHKSNKEADKQKQKDIKNIKLDSEQIAKSEQDVIKSSEKPLKSVKTDISGVKEIFKALYDINKVRRANAKKLKNDYPEYFAELKTKKFKDKQAKKLNKLNKKAMKNAGKIIDNTKLLTPKNSEKTAIKNKKLLSTFAAIDKKMKKIESKKVPEAVSSVTEKVEPKTFKAIAQVDNNLVEHTQKIMKLMETQVEFANVSNQEYSIKMEAVKDPAKKIQSSVYDSRSKVIEAIKNVKSKDNAIDKTNKVENVAEKKLNLELSK